MRWRSSELRQRPGVVSVQDAQLAADFNFLRTARSTIRELFERYDFAALADAAVAWMAARLGAYTGQGLMSVLVAALMTAGCTAGGRAISASSAKPSGVSSTRLGAHARCPTGGCAMRQRRDGRVHR